MYGTYMYMCEARHLCVLKIYLNSHLFNQKDKKKKGGSTYTCNKHILQMTMR